MPGDSENWIDLLPIVLLNIWLAPRHKLKLNAFELLYGRPIIPQAQGHLRPLEMERLKYALQTGDYETSYRVCNQCCHSFWPGDGANLKRGKNQQLA